MKKIFGVTLVLLTVSVSAHAMTVSQQWSKVYGGDMNDAIYTIIQTIDGGYIAAGATKSFGVGVMNMWVLKLDSNGEIEWQKTYGLSWLNQAYSIKQTSDGGYIVAGSIADIGNVYAAILKLDSNGNITWQRAYGGFNQFVDILQTADGGYVAITGSETTVLKLDSAGNFIWAKEIRSTLNNSQLRKIQQTSDGGYIVTGILILNNYDWWILKLNSAGDIIWEKIYEGSYRSSSIQQTTDGGYIVAGDVGSDALILKLDSNGNITWQKAYGGSGHDYAVSVKEVMNGYVVVGTTGDDYYITMDMWVLQLDTNGDITWQKTYGSDDGDNGVSYQTTTDGGIIMAGNTYSFSTNDTADFWLLKLDSNGEIPDCDVIGISDATATDTNVQVLAGSSTTQSISPIVTDPNLTPQNSSAETTLVCYYEDPNDMDGDGVENTPGGTIASSMFLAVEDNCPDMPNGPSLGTCIKGNVGNTCISDEACGVGGVCSMAQEDSYPPQGNGIGDACDCEADFNCDGNVAADDVDLFLTDFGRSTFFNPCTNADPCNGDINCDTNVAADDVTLFLEDFGRSQFFNPCPTCEVGNWCVYDTAPPEPPEGLTIIQ